MLGGASAPPNFCLKDIAHNVMLFVFVVVVVDRQTDRQLIA